MTDDKDDANWTGDISILLDDAGVGPSLRTGDLEAHLPSRAPAVNETADLLMSGDLFPPQRGFKRHDLGAHEVAVRIWKDKLNEPKLGRIRNASINGAFIETDAPLPLRTSIRMKLPVAKKSVIFEGKVVRRGKDGMAVELVTDDSTWAHRREFIKQAQEGGHAPVLSIEVLKPKGESVASRRGEEFDVLSALWATVSTKLGDNAAHQNFIAECVRCRRAEFALERYQELLEKDPKEPRLLRCIEQLEHLLAACWVGDAPAPEVIEPKPQILWVAGGLGFVGLLVLIYLSAS